MRASRPPHPPALHNFLTPIFNGLATLRPKWAKIIPLPPALPPSDTSPLVPLRTTEEAGRLGNERSGVIFSYLLPLILVFL